MAASHFFTCFLTLLLLSSKGVSPATFTFVNKCDYTVWAGILGTPKLDSTGFELLKGTSRSFQAPTGWSGRFWGRTGCNFDGSGQGTCATADCGSGQIECNGAGANPPATLAEFTLGSGSQDFYDVSLVDGYNVQMIVEASGGSGNCASTGCVTDLNRKCPSELKVDGGSACRSASEAFGRWQTLSRREPSRVYFPLLVFLPSSVFPFRLFSSLNLLLPRFILAAGGKLSLGELRETNSKGGRRGFFHKAGETE